MKSKATIKSNWFSVKFHGIDVVVNEQEKYVFADAYGNVYATAHDPYHPKASWEPRGFRKLCEINMDGLNHRTWKETITSIK